MERPLLLLFNAGLYCITDDDGFPREFVKVGGANVLNFAALDGHRQYRMVETSVFLLLQYSRSSSSSSFSFTNYCG
jgi:hypothetical protein